MSGFDRAENISKLHTNNAPESLQSWIADFGNGIIDGLRGKAPHSAFGQSIGESMGEAADLPRRRTCEIYQVLKAFQNRSQQSGDAHADQHVPPLELIDESSVFCKK